MRKKPFFEEQRFILYLSIQICMERSAIINAVQKNAAIFISRIEQERRRKEEAKKKQLYRCSILIFDEKHNILENSGNFQFL